MTKPSNPVRPQGRWPAVLAVLAFCGLYYLLPEHLTVGPGWLLIAVAVALLIPSSVSHRRGRHDINNAVAYVLLGFLTLGLIGSLGLLIARLPQHKDPPVQLLEAAAALWLSNILLFASWYWRLDAGGPNARDRAGAHVDGAFLFPQMTMDDDLRRRMNEHEWSPGFVDYLFLAFNTSTALSPTDVPVLSRWAKGLMVVRSMISLATIVLLAARAVNIL